MPDENNQPQIKSCPEIPFFGASYPDATCIDGFLWDLDKEEDGQLYGGGDVPCPFCNQAAFLEYEVDELNGVTEQSLLNWIDKMRVKYS